MKDMVYSDHIYVEEELLDACDPYHLQTERIIDFFKDRQIIPIGHYKDVFNRSRQDVCIQADNKKIIIARKRGRLVYEGAPVCQSFGNSHFFYTSCVMNCIFDCSYCYLKGMYPSANIVIFVNIEDIFSGIEDLLKLYPVYLCVSYDTDLLGLEDITGYVKKWSGFASCHRDLTVEIRTKCGRVDVYDELDKTDNVIFAYSLSPDEVISAYEKKNAGLISRIKAAEAAMNAGFPVRFCFDPMIRINNWKEAYAGMFEEICRRIDIKRVKDHSVGSFRISADYLKKMRERYVYEPLIWYPFSEDKGYYSYAREISDEMESFMEGLITKKDPAASVFRWRDETGR